MQFDDVNFELQVIAEETAEQEVSLRWEDMMFDIYQRMAVAEEFDFYS